MLHKLRKFGLQYCDLPTMMSNLSVLFRVVAINIDSRHSKRVPRLAIIINIIGAGIYFYVYLWSMVWFVFWRCRENGDLVTAMIIFSLGFSSEIGMSKLFIMFLYRNKVKEIMDGYLACDALVEPNSRFAKNLSVTLRNVKKRALIFGIVFVGNGIMYILKALVTPGRHTLEDLFIIHGLEPQLETPYYEIGLICSIIGCFYACFPSATVTGFLTITTGYAEAQLIALSEELQCLLDDANDQYQAENNDSLSIIEDVAVESESRNQIINAYVKIKLDNIVKMHVKVLLLVKEIEVVFSGAIAIEFFLLMISLIAELLGGLENTYMQVPYAFMQVAWDCTTGQRLMSTFEDFNFAVYDCRWEQLDKSNMRTVLMMLKVSQKKVSLSAGGIATLSFECLMTVIKSIYSAFTTLRTTMS